MALLFAATHPERTTAVIAYGAWTNGTDTRPAYPWAPSSDEGQWLDDLERNWGRGAMFLDDLVPTLVGDKRYEAWYAKLERLAASPGAAVALARMAMQIDVRDVLPTIHVPTLVLHRRDDRAIPVEDGRFIAERVPGATFVELPGADHWPWIGDGRAVEEIQEFLTGMRGGGTADRVLATVMFIDIVESTKRAADLGDRRWTDLLEGFYSVVRRELDRFGGREIDTAGDGFFVTFDGPARAIRCAGSLVEAVEKVGLAIRVGIHTGEVERAGGQGERSGRGDRSAGRSPCRARGDPRLQDREGPRGRIRRLVRTSGGASTEGRARQLGAVSRRLRACRSQGASWKRWAPRVGPWTSWLRIGVW